MLVEQRLAEDVSQAFAERFGRPPEGAWQAPGRVNLIGEHTDYNDGFVLPIAIDRHVTLAAARRDDDLVVVVSRELGEATVRLSEVAPGGAARWSAYVAGSLWALAQEGAPVGGLDMLLTSDVPVGSGLSSSAALECAVLLAARDLYGGPGDRTALARAGQRGENEIVGAPVGIMDQMASLHGRAGHALLLDCRDLHLAHVPLRLEEAGLALLVLDTRVSHAHAGGEYGERRAACEEAARVLGVRALRDADLTGLEAAAGRLGPEVLRRARHVVTENARVSEAVALLREGRPQDLGPVFAASHASMRDDFEISSPELDTAVEAATAAGALAARMTGGGFGGSAVALVPAAAAPAVGEAVVAAFAARGHASPSVFPVTAASGAERVR